MKYIFTILALIISLNAISQDGTVSEYPMKDGALLWQITNENNSDTSHLFGTMHMIESQFYIFPDQLRMLAKNSDAIVMELPGLPSPYEMLKYVMLKDDTLWNYFGAGQEDSLMAWIDEFTDYERSMVKNVFSKMKPFALIQLTTASQFKGKVESYEMDFTEIANSDSIKIIGLETVADQMKIFDDMSIEEQVEMLMVTVRDPDADKDLMESMQSIYYSQEIDELYELIHEDDGTIAEKEKAFLTDRNKNWIGILKNILPSSKLFIAVGAGHLGGPEGIIRLLQKEGYTLTPIEL
jgi:uncharacterized protein YbaP (TraB family)